MAESLKGHYTCINPVKYCGGHAPIFRSSWEFAVMQCFDKHPNVVNWASEPFGIPYYNPIKKKWSQYHPDFFVRYVDQRGKEYREIIEVKPAKECEDYTGRSSYHDKVQQAINRAKWQAARAFCVKYGMTFRVCTEKDMFAYVRQFRGA